MSNPKSWREKVDVDNIVTTVLKEVQVTVDVQADPALAELGEDALDGLEFSLQLSPREIKDLKDNSDKQVEKRLGRLEDKISDSERESGALSALGASSLPEKFKELGSRFGQKFADKAIILVQEAIQSGDLSPAQLFNPSQVVLETEIPIPGKLRDLARLKPSYGVRGAEKGKGEMLASIMFGFDAEVEEPDITIPTKGGWHIKSFGNEKSGATTVQSGEGAGVTAGINTFLDKYSDYGVKKGINMRQSFIDKVQEKVNLQHGTNAAQEFRDDWNALAAISTTEPNGSAEGMVRLNRDQSFYFIPANKVRTNGISKGGRMELYRDPLSTPTPQSSIDAMRKGDTSWRTPDVAGPSPDEDSSRSTYAQNFGSVNDSVKRSKTNNLLERVEIILLKEELNRADKKEIDKMIAKRIEADRVQQRKEFQKNLQKELKSSKFQKAIMEIAKQELSKEIKGKELQESVLDITKQVIKKLYRELSYSYNPVIDRIKL